MACKTIDDSSQGRQAFAAPFFIPTGPKALGIARAHTRVRPSMPEHARLQNPVVEQTTTSIFAVALPVKVKSSLRRAAGNSDLSPSA